MAIGSVVRRGNVAVVYDARGRQKAMIPLGGADAEVQGYTGTTISVRRGNVVTIYDERGRRVGMVVAR